jgi:uncharacterized protein Yka (UPF0111/DUF47 family)
MGLWDLVKKVKNIRLLPPRDKEFYVLFSELADTLVKASNLLVVLFDASQQERDETEVRISNYLTRCGQISESIAELLRTAQQPPFGRAEISDFSDGSLRIIKYIHHAANRYVVYDFPSSDKEMRELAPIIVEACKEIAKAVESLQKNRNIDPFYRAVDILEDRADVIYHEGLRRRFHEIRQDRIELEQQLNQISSKASIEELRNLIKDNVEYTRHTAVFFILRQVYAELERAIDACTDLMVILKRMVSTNV